MIIYFILLTILFLYLAFNVFYLLIFALAALFQRKTVYSTVDPKWRIMVLIPTYKEDAIILETVRNAIHQNYPIKHFEVTVIADQLRESTMAALSQLPIRLIPVSFEKSTKARSLKYALQQLPDDRYDIAMILDADNIMGPGCLEKINHAFQAGFEMVQLHRTAKNRNTPTAILDAASEEINNHIFRRGHRALGLSSALIGSGMAFRYADFKTLMTETDIENNPGEDREIYLEFLRRGKICEYIEDGLVYDEKVQSGKVLENQRTRWFSAQLQYAKRFWIDEPSKTFSHNIHYFDYALQTLLLPRALLLATILLMGTLSISFYWIFDRNLFPGTLPWIAVGLLCIISLLVSTIPHLSLRELFMALKQLPKTCWHLVRALVKSRSDQKEFIHTPKEYIK